MAPPRERIAQPSLRDQQQDLQRFAKLTPSRVADVLSKAERGELFDWADLCDRVLIDGHVRAAYETRLDAVAGASWSLESGELTGDPARDRYASDAATFVSRALTGIADFEQAVLDLSDGIGKGAGVQEIPWEYDSGAWIARELWWLHLRRFRYDRGWKLLLCDDGMTVNYPGRPLTPNRFIVHQPRTVAAYPAVTAAMRAVVWAFLFKRWGLQFWVNGAESFSWPFMVGTVPRGAGKDVRAKALETLEKLSADHRAIVEDGTAFELIETVVKDSGTWKQLVEALDREISKAILGTTDSVEPGKNGAFRAVESRKGTTIDARIAIDERALAGTITRDLILPLLAFNKHLFGGVMPPVPRISWNVNANRRQIPQVLVDRGAVSDNELRTSAGLPTVEGHDLLISEEAKLASALVAGEKVSDSGLAGVQIGQLVAIVQSVKAGLLPKASALEIITVSFPTISRERASAMLDPAEPDPNAPPAPMPPTAPPPVEEQMPEAA